MFLFFLFSSYFLSLKTFSIFLDSSVRLRWTCWTSSEQRVWRAINPSGLDTTPPPPSSRRLPGSETRWGRKVKKVKKNKRRVMSRCRGATIHSPGFACSLNLHHTAILLWPRLAHVDSQFSGLDFLCSDLPWRICVATCTHSAAWCRSSTAAIRMALWSWSSETGWTTAGVWCNRTFRNDNFLVVFLFFFWEKFFDVFLQVQGPGLRPWPAEFFWPPVWAVACSAHHKP